MNQTNRMAVHEAAIAEYEREADEFEAQGAPHVAAIFRNMAGNRRRLLELERTAQVRALEQTAQRKQVNE